MSCFRTPQLTEIELLMALDGEADPEVTMHLTHCPECRARAGQLQKLQHELTGQLFRIECPSSLEVGEYYLGMLPSARATVIAQHLAKCPRCVEEIVELKAYMDQPDPFLRPGPITSIKRQVQVLIGRLASGFPSGGLAGGLAPAPALAGLRGDVAGPLTFAAGDAQVMIDIQDDAGNSGRRSIFGLLLGFDTTVGARVHLWQAGRMTAQVDVDEFGNFVFSGLTPAAYDLIITGNQVEIHIEDIDVTTT